MLHGQSRDITRALVRDLIPEFVVSGEFLVKQGSIGKKLIFIHQCAAAPLQRLGSPSLAWPSGASSASVSCTHEASAGVWYSVGL